MPVVETDRREFLGLALPLAIGVVTADATSPPPPNPPKKGDALKAATGSEVLPLPAGASGRLGSPRMRVNGHVNKAQFAPKGNVLVAASSELRGWDPNTGKVVFRLAYPDNTSIDAGRLTTRDTFVLLIRAQSGNAFEIRHYSFEGGKLLAWTPPMSISQGQHTAFSADGKLMAIVLQEGLRLYDTENGAQLWHESLPAESVTSCVISDENKFVAVSTKGEIKIFSVSTGKQTSALKTQGVGGTDGKAQRSGRGRDWIQDVVVSADGQWIAAGVGEDADVVCCWELKSAQLKHTFKPATKPIAFTPNAVELLTYRDGVATFWNMLDGKSRKFAMPIEDDLFLSPNGKTLASSAGDSIILIDAQTGKHLPYSSDPPGLPEALTYRGSRLRGRLSGWGGWVEWDTKSGSSRLIRSANASGFTPIAISHDGKTALYRKKSEYTIRDVQTGNVLVTHASQGGAEDPTAAAMTPDGAKFLKWNGDGLIIQEPGGKARTIEHKSSEGQFASIAISGDGRFAALIFNTPNSRGSVDLFDISAEKFVRHLDVEGDIGQAAITPDGEWLAVTHDSDRLGNAQFARFGNLAGATILETGNGKKVVSLPAGAQNDRVMAISNDGRVLARTEQFHDIPHIVLWEVLAGSPRARFEMRDSVSSFAFSPDGRTLAASVQGGPIFLWDLHGSNKSSIPRARDIEKAWENLSAVDDPEGAVPQVVSAAVSNFGVSLQSAGEQAFAAIRLLAAHPEVSTPFLRKLLPPVSPPDEKVVARLIDGLDHKDFRKREVAMRTLAELGERVRGPLQKALSDATSPETRERLERLLAAENQMSPATLRMLRAIEAMEVAGTPEAIELLEYWANGAPGALFTRNAGSARNRVAARMKS